MAVLPRRLVLWGCLLALACSHQGAEAASMGGLVAQLLTPANLAAHYLECLGVLMVLIYVVNIVLGRRSNHALAQVGRCGCLSAAFLTTGSLAVTSV